MITLPADAPVILGDPLPAARVYYRHLETGDRGYAVVRDKKPAIKWDRPMSSDYTHEVSKWKAEEDTMPLFSAHQVAMVAFVADKEVCRALGQLDIANRTWLDLSEKQRHDWMKDGPKAKVGPRRDVFEAVRKAMGSHGT